MSRLVVPPEQRIRQRYAWFQDAERVGNVSLACKRLGISPKTFYKWKQPFTLARGDRQALRDRSRRPHRRRRLLALRRQTHLGPARLRALLLRRGTHHVPSAMTIAKLLRQAGLTRR